MDERKEAALQRLAALLRRPRLTLGALAVLPASELEALAVHIDGCLRSDADTLAAALRRIIPWPWSLRLTGKDPEARA